MRGNIRSRERCPVHRCAYKGSPLVCPKPDCQQRPAGGFYLEIYWQSAQHKIYSDKEGGPLDSWSRAWNVLAEINVEIKGTRWDPEAYNQRRQHRPGSYTIEAYGAKVIDDLEAGQDSDQVRESTIKLYRMYLKRHIVPELKALGVVDVRDVRMRTLKDLRARLLEKEAWRGKGRKLSPKNVRNILSFAVQILRIGKEEGMVAAEPPRRPKVKVPKRKYRVLAQDQQLQVLQDLTKEEPWHAPIFWCAYYTGMRPGELAACKVRDFDPKRGQLRLRNRKAHDEHAIPLPGELVAMLEKMLDERRASKTPPMPDALLFVMPAVGGSAGGQAYRNNTLPRIWHRACDRVQVDYIGLYNSTKHSLAYRMLQLGFTRDQIGEFLGITPKSTENYAEFSAELLRPISEKLHGTSPRLDQPEQPQV